MATTRREGRTRARRRTTVRPPRESRDLPFTGRNAGVFIIGIAVIIVGYFFLSQPPVDGFLSLTLAPILLVIGYCVLIPIALLIGDPKTKDADTKSVQENKGG